MMTEVLALIPARGGSKGIPRKNIRDFSGYPLIAWSIAAGLKSEFVTRVIVSTDDAEIAAVAREWGAETPFLRPAEFAEDKTTDLPVFVHALEWLEQNEGYKPDVVVQLRPTSPVRPLGLVDDAVRILLQHADADSVRGIVPAGQNPHKMWRLPAGEAAPMTNLLAVEGIAEPYNAPRQILPDVYWQTGHIDAIRPAAILSGSMSGKTIYPLLIDPNFTVDLDNLRTGAGRAVAWRYRDGLAGPAACAGEASCWCSTTVLSPITASGSARMVVDDRCQPRRQPDHDQVAPDGHQRSFCRRKSTVVAARAKDACRGIQALV
jgi:CMP-N-acetylneuraminic acid synthetase